jgi:hypothetical protein
VSLASVGFLNSHSLLAHPSSVFRSNADRFSVSPSFDPMPRFVSPSTLRRASLAKKDREVTKPWTKYLGIGVAGCGSSHNTVHIKEADYDV